MIYALVIVPAVCGLLAFALRSATARRALLLCGAVAHTACTATCWAALPSSALDGALSLDAPGLIFLSITSVLFLAAAAYALGYLGRETHGARTDFEEGVIFSNAPEAVFAGCLLFFLATMSLVCVSQHFGLLWVAIEATTLASAPLIYFHRHHRSLEATWKYLLICSVGIALALVGNFMLALAAAGPGEDGVPLVLRDLLANGGALNPRWLKAAFLFFLVGYGTKMGLAPLHTWLPDAHSEAPSVVSALLSGALLNCAFLGVLRAQQVCAAAGLGDFGRELLVLFGLVSMAFAAVFILRQADFKRMLAYSSVEHMGILALGVGLGGTATVGAMLHAVNHSLTKGMLFLVAGNILACYRTKSTRDVQGVLRVLPYSGVLWVAGFLAITGSPPFGPFLSEFTILKGCLEGGHTAIAALYLVLLALVFIGMATVVLRMAQGTPVPPSASASGSHRVFKLEQPMKEAWSAVLPPAVLALAVLLLGVYVPPGLQAALAAAAKALGGGS